jgi:hypothetical protein
VETVDHSKYLGLCVQEKDVAGLYVFMVSVRAIMALSGNVVLLLSLVLTLVVCLSVQGQLEQSRP